MNETKRKGLTKTEVITIVAAVVVIAILLALLVPALSNASKMEKQFKDYQEKTNQELADMTAKLEGSLTAADMQKLLSEALAKVDGSLTEDQVKAIIESAIAGIEFPSGLTSSQVKKIITDALKDINTGLSKEEIEEIISGILANQPADPVPFDLKAALEAGGSYAMTGDAKLEAVTIAKDVVSALDLKGYTLTVGTEWLIYGNLAVTNGTIIIERPDEEEAIYMHSGLCVEESGILKLDDVTIIGKRLWNIENNGALYLTDAKYTVEGGYGLANSGAAVVKNCTMIANGAGTAQIYSIGGTVDVSATEFVEGSNFVSYYYAAPIEVYNSAVTLDAVKITVSADEYSIWAGNSGKVTVKSGVVNTKVACVNDSSVTIYGGTVNGVAFEDITAASDIFVGVDSKLTQGENCWIIGQ